MGHNDPRVRHTRSARVRVRADGAERSLGADDAPGAEWERYERSLPTEELAVRLWENATLYANTKPVSISPEPDWTRYTYDGYTPLNR